MSVFEQFFYWSKGRICYDVEGILDRIGINDRDKFSIF